MILFIFPSLDYRLDRIPSPRAGASSERGDAGRPNASRDSAYALALLFLGVWGRPRSRGARRVCVRIRRERGRIALRAGAAGRADRRHRFLPAPGFWEGRPATAGGFEAGLADALAKRLGL